MKWYRKRNEAEKLLTENREILDKISDYLYEKETITGKEFMKMFREMKGIPEEDASETKSSKEKSSETEGDLMEEQNENMFEE